MQNIGNRIENMAKQSCVYARELPGKAKVIIKEGRVYLVEQAPRKAKDAYNQTRLYLVESVPAQVHDVMSKIDASFKEKTDTNRKDNLMIVAKSLVCLIPILLALTVLDVYTSATFSYVFSEDTVKMNNGKLSYIFTILLPVFNFIREYGFWAIPFMSVISRIIKKDHGLTNMEGTLMVGTILLGVGYFLLRSVLYSVLPLSYKIPTASLSCQFIFGILFILGMFIFSLSELISIGKLPNHEKKTINLVEWVYSALLLCVVVTTAAVPIFIVMASLFNMGTVTVEV